jgi:cytochrome P450
MRHMLLRSSTDLRKFDPLDVAVLLDPYPTYAALRHAGPVCRGGPGQWVVTRYQEVAALLGDPRLSHCFPNTFYRYSVGDGPASEFFQRILLDRDPPAHTRLRKLLSQGFTSARVAVLSARIGALVDELLAPALDRVAFDLVADLAFPLPLLVMGEVIGLPTADLSGLRSRALELSKAFGIRIPEQDRPAANAAVTWLRSYVEAVVDERRKAPREDLLSRLVAADEGAGDVAHGELIDNIVFLLFAGFETTTNLLANGCAALFEHPDQMVRLWLDHSFVATAVEEFLRYDAPIQTVARWVLQPVAVGGRLVREGRVLVLLLGSANRDDNEYAAPERLDVGRRPNRHVSFGGGAHRCLGASLARLEAAIVFDRLRTRCAVLEPAAESVRRLIPNFRSYARLPARATPS